MKIIPNKKELMLHNNNYIFNEFDGEESNLQTNDTDSLSNGIAWNEIQDYNILNLEQELNDNNNVLNNEQNKAYFYFQNIKSYDLREHEIVNNANK